jgi:hypothetical protein
LLGIDSDNGSEFINEHLIKYCRQEGITFTRSRANRKNDNCFVEEKNYTLVRRAVGYMRHDTEKEVQILNRLYFYLCLRWNYFLPSMKLESKQRVGSKVIKRYSSPETPYNRLLKSNDVPNDDKKELKKRYVELNPVQLTREIVRLQQELLKTVQKKHKRKKAA